MYIHLSKLTPNKWSSYHANVKLLAMMMFYAANTIFIYKSDKPIQFNAPEKDLYKLQLEMK